MPKENCNECKKELDVEEWISKILETDSDVQIICIECENKMSGRDERPTLKLTKDSFSELCPHCQQSNGYDFKTRVTNYRWQGLVGTLRWSGHGLVADLSDARTTANSIGKKILMCGSCKEVIGKDTKVGKLLLEVFRETKAENDNYWRAALEKIRVKTPVKVSWEVKYDPL